MGDRWRVGGCGWSGRLEIQISEEQQVHVKTRCLGVVLVMGMGDWKGVEKFSTEEIRELSLSGHVAPFQILVLWATYIYPQVSQYSLSLPIVLCCYLSYLLSNHTLSDTLWGKILICSAKTRSFFHVRSTLNLCGRHRPHFWEFPGLGPQFPCQDYMNCSALRPRQEGPLPLAVNLWKSPTFHKNAKEYRIFILRIRGHLSSYVTQPDSLSISRD